MLLQAGGTIDHLTNLMKSEVKSLQQTFLVLSYQLNEKRSQISTANFFGTIYMIMAAGILILKKATETSILLKTNMTKCTQNMGLCKGVSLKSYKQ